METFNPNMRKRYNLYYLVTIKDDHCSATFYDLAQALQVKPTAILCINPL